MILLDTHALLWALDDDAMLSARARQAISVGPICVSVASLWEMSIKASLTREERRLTLDRSIPELAELCESLGIDIIPITPEDCEQVMSLPHLHEDPFDRMIMAQAMTRGIGLVTRDEKIWAYDGVDTVW